MDGLKDEAVMEGGKESSVEKDSNNDTSHEPKTAVNPNDLCDVIVEECSDSSRSSSSSSSSEDESSSSDEEINEDRDDSDESSDELDRAKDSSPPVDAIPGLFERSLKVEEKSSAESSSSTTGIVADTAAVAATAAAAATAAERFSPTEEENVFDQYFEPVCRRCRELRALLLEVDEDVEADAMEFHFTLEQLGDKTGPPIICSLCMKDGHYKDACPDEVLPELAPLPPMTAFHQSSLDSVLNAIPQDYAPQHQETRLRTAILQELQAFVRELYPDSSLQLFGSSVNGFGFGNSDMDICMTLGGKHDEEGGLADPAEVKKIIEKLAKKFRSHRDLTNVFAITTAKVPIVKFTFTQGRSPGAKRIDGDISLYNTLALHNTRMLALYSELDSRVKTLGYVMKVFAKLCDIGDASRGSLSSYAYVILALHFLQQREPPVIPVLQEIDHLERDGRKKKTIVDGWNAWYFSGSKEQLRKLWSGWGKNTETIGQLWIGLLRYYTEQFPIKDRVVTIKQFAPLTRLEKMWTGPCIAIEDPFDLNHNLGGGLSRKMNSFILKAFIRGRALFGTPTRGVVAIGYPYFFDQKRLTDGKPPADRGCHVCGKIGHYVRDCPVDKANKEKLAAQRKESQARKSSVDNTGNNSNSNHGAQGNNNNNNNNSDSNNKNGNIKQNSQTQEEARRKNNEGTSRAKGAANAGDRGGGGNGSGESDSGNGRRRNSRASQSSDDGFRNNGRGGTPSNTNQRPYADRHGQQRLYCPGQQQQQHLQQQQQAPTSQQQSHQQHQRWSQQQPQPKQPSHQQLQQLSQNQHQPQMRAPNNRQNPPSTSKNPRNLATGSHHLPSPSGPSGAAFPGPQMRTPPRSGAPSSSSSSNQSLASASPSSSQQAYQIMKPGVLRCAGPKSSGDSSSSSGPSTPKLGQSLDMKELFALAGGSPVSLGSLPGSVQGTPSPQSHHSIAGGSGGLNTSSQQQQQQQHRAITSSSGGGGGANKPPTQPVFTQNNHQRPPLPRGDHVRTTAQTEDSRVSRERPMAQHIAHIGSLSSSYAMETRGGIFDAPLLAPPMALPPAADLMQNIQISSRQKESPVAATVTATGLREEQPPVGGPPPSVSLPSQSHPLPPSSSASYGRASFHTMRSLDDVAFQSADAIGLGSSEMSFREIIAAKLNPVPRQQQQQHHQSPPHAADPNHASSSALSFRATASSTWADPQSASALSNAAAPAAASVIPAAVSSSSSSMTANPSHSFPSIPVGSGLAADPLASIWSPISATSNCSWKPEAPTAASAASWTPETPPSTITSASADDIERRRYSREALMQIRSRASPRASLSSDSSASSGLGGGGAVGVAVSGSNKTSDDDILGLGNLFLPKASPASVAGFSSLSSSSSTPAATAAASLNPHPAIDFPSVGAAFPPMPTGLTYRSSLETATNAVGGGGGGRTGINPSLPTNLSLTDDIKSALRIGEADAAAAARRPSANVVAETSMPTALLRLMEQRQQQFSQQQQISQQQQQQQLSQLQLQQLSQYQPHQLVAAASLPGAAVSTARGSTTGAIARMPNARPPLPVSAAGQPVVRLAFNPNIQSDSRQ